MRDEAAWWLLVAATLCFLAAVLVYAVLGL